MRIQCFNNNVPAITIYTDDYMSVQAIEIIIALRCAKNINDVREIFLKNVISDLTTRSKFLLLAMGTDEVNLYTTSIYDQLLDIFLTTMLDWKLSIKLSALTPDHKDPFLDYMVKDNELSEFFYKIPKLIW